MDGFSEWHIHTLPQSYTRHFPLLPAVWLQENSADATASTAIIKAVRLDRSQQQKQQQQQQQQQPPPPPPGRGGACGACGDASSPAASALPSTGFWQQGRLPPQPPLSNCELNLATAVEEEVAVYDLHPQLHSQAQALAQQAQQADGTHRGPRPDPSCEAPSASSSRRLSYAAAVTAAGSAEQAASQALPPLVSRPSTQRQLSAGEVPGQAAAAAAAAAAQALTAAGAVRQWGHLLTAHEQSEVLSYPQVWFVGRLGTEKRQGEWSVCLLD